MEMTTIQLIIEIIGMILTLIAAFIMVMIGRKTGWFTAWYILSAAFFLIAVRRTISWFAGKNEIASVVNSVLLLILGIMYVIGFSMLYKIFKKQQEKTIKMKGDKKIK